MRYRFFISLILIFISACVPFKPTPHPSEIQPASAFTETPTLIVSPSTPTYSPSPLDDAANTAYYFAPDICNAKWSNNGQDIPCPGVEDQSPGYVNLLTEIELNLPYKANAILSVPPQDGNYLDIFGAFPPRTIGLNDFFRAQLYCMPDTQCDVTFSLGYYDSSGKFLEPFPAWPYNYTQLPRLINFPLDILAGQTVKLTLVVRDNGDPTGDYAVWVEPRIYRNLEIFTPIP